MECQIALATIGHKVQGLIFMNYHKNLQSHLYQNLSTSTRFKMRMGNRNNVNLSLKIVSNSMRESSKRLDKLVWKAKSSPKRVNKFRGMEWL